MHVAPGDPVAPTISGRPPSRRVLQYRYGLLLISIFASFGVQGIAPPGPVQEIVVTALAGAALILACSAAALSRRIVTIAMTVAGIAVALSVARATVGGIGEGAARAMNALLVALGPPAIVYGVIHDLRTSGQVRLEAVMGVLSLYVLLGMLFAFVFGAIDRLGGAPVFANGESATASQCLYFSFTTLTTVGYGDLTTRSDLGHTLAVTEALIGQIYLVTVVSVLVSNLRRPVRRTGDDHRG